MKELFNAITQKEYFESKVFKVLILEDNPNINLLLKINLMDMGNFIIETCHEPRQAILMYISTQPDLMIVDVNLPEMNGFQFHEMMKVAKGSVCPTLFISANESYANDVLKMNSRKVAFVSKPFKYEEIQENLLSMYVA